MRTEIVQAASSANSVTLTGEVQARFNADLAFRISGRVVERLRGGWGSRRRGQVLARLDPAEQQADLDAAGATMTGAESQLRVATATFERQRTLLSNGFTTRVVFDQAQEGLQSAQASLQDAKAQLGRAKTRGDTELRASAAGVITARKLESAKWWTRVSRSSRLAQDGDRDAIFDVDERILLGDTERSDVALKLLSDPNVIGSWTCKGGIAGSGYEGFDSAREDRNSRSGARHGAWKRCRQAQSNLGPSRRSYCRGPL